MTVIATCGCVLPEKERLGETFFIKDYDREGNKCISHKTICKKCQVYYQSANLILESEQDQMIWIDFHLMNRGI